MKVGHRELLERVGRGLSIVAGNRVKLILMPLLVSIGVAVAFYGLVSAYVMSEAREDIENILLSHRGFHHYIQQVMHPAFYKARADGEIKMDFYAPELLSSSFMVRVLHAFYNEERRKEKLPDIYYKLAATNPRNPINQADPFEADLIAMFNRNRTIKEYQRIIKVDGHNYLYYALPFLENTPACLKCHGQREDAPPGLQARYPGAVGFGEKVGNIRAIESIRTPIEHEMYAAYILTGSLSAGLIAFMLLLVFNTRLRELVRLKTASLQTEVIERQQAEKSIRLLNNLINQSNDAIFVIVPETGRFHDVNDKACQSLGYTRSELFTMTVMQVSGQMMNEEAWRQHVSDLRGRGSLLFEDKHRRKDGIFISMEVNVCYITMIDGDYMVAVARDLTERKKLEDQLLQSQKMEAVGQLAGGIAHDFNNMLTAITGYGSLLKMKMEPATPLLGYVDQILSSAEKSANLTRQLLAFSRKEVICPKEIDLNELIRNIEKLLRRLIGDDVEMSTCLQPGILPILADPGQMEQVLLNLATNARDAMPHGGQLYLRTELADIAHDSRQLSTLIEPGHYVIMAVTDTGAGMDEKTQTQIFDPFFTTKAIGKGTGLGLAIVYSIVRQHRGYIHVYSELGKGTTFRIYLPLIDTLPVTSLIKELTPSKGGTETILLVEDSEEVRTINRSVLQEFGYTVIEACDGEEAVRIFSENRDRIQLVLLDVIMPKKNGREAYNEICQIRPDIRVLFTSGYTADIIQRRGISDPGLNFIAKPTSPTALLAKVREILDRATEL
jgi:PAS domain S-box-containing protein